MNISNRFRKIKKKIKKFLKDEKGSPTWEYILLIGFGLFIFFIIVSIVVSTLEWTTGQVEDFNETFEDAENSIVLLKTFICLNTISNKKDNF